jgi:very-short-patch-repair endonuclease
LEREVAELAGTQHGVVDGRRYHHHVDAYETDRARDLSLAAAGFRTVRVTWRRLHREPDILAAELRSVLLGLNWRLSRAIGLVSRRSG